MRSLTRPLVALNCLCLVGLASFFGCESAEQDAAFPAAPATVGKQETNGAIAEAIRGQADLQDTLQESVTLPDGKRELKALLAQKETEQLRPEDAAEQFQIQKVRAAASARLLAKFPKSTPDEEFEFVRVRLDSLMKLIGMGDPEAQHELQKSIRQLADHRHPQIRQAVALAGLLHDYQRRLRDADANIQPILEAATKIASEFPDSHDVCLEMVNLSSRMLKEGDRQNWLKLTEILVQQYRGSADPTCRNIAARLASQLQLASANLDVIVRAIASQEPDAMEQFGQAVNYLMARQDITPQSIQSIVSAVAWLEQSGRTNECLQANQIVAVACAGMPTGPLKDQLTANCDRRQQRLGWIGNPFSIEGISLRGTPLNWIEFSNDSPVLVAFWSPSEPGSVKRIKQLAKVFEQHKTQGLKLLAVNVSDKSDAASLFGNEVPEWEIVKADPRTISQADDYFNRFGITKLPHVFLIDRQGLTVATNPNSETIASTIRPLAQASNDDAGGNR